MSFAEKESWGRRNRKRIMVLQMDAGAEASVYQLVEVKLKGNRYKGRYIVSGTFGQVYLGRYIWMVHQSGHGGRYMSGDLLALSPSRNNILISCKIL